MAYKFRIYNKEVGSRGEMLVLNILNYFVNNYVSFKDYLEEYKASFPNADKMDKYQSLSLVLYEDDVCSAKGQPLSANLVRSFYILAGRELEKNVVSETDELLKNLTLRLYHPNDMEEFEEVENSNFSYIDGKIVLVGG